MPPLQQPTMLFAVNREVVVFVNEKEPPDDDTWKAYLGSIRTAAEQHGRVRIVIVSGGGAPTPTQREAAGNQSRELKGKDRAAVVTDALLARGVVTALSWQGLAIKAFPKRKLPQAFAYLDLSEPEREWALATVANLQARL